MTMQLFWHECEFAEVPGHTEWLSAEEQSCFSRLRFQKRRDDWLLGRWTAKCAIAAYLREGLTLFPQITILPDSTGAPTVDIRGRAADLSLSISHREGRAFAAVGPAGVTIGADIELVESHSQVFTEDYFTPEETEQLRQPHDLHPDALSTLLWSAKESALKLLHLGLRADTRCVSIHISHVHRPGTTWRQFDAIFVDGRKYQGWWRQSGDRIYSQIGSQPSDAPIELPALVGVL